MIFKKNKKPDDIANCTGCNSQVTLFKDHKESAKNGIYLNLFNRVIVCPKCNDENKIKLFKTWLDSIERMNQCLKFYKFCKACQNFCKDCQNF